jgi:hypothetical protein
VTWTAPPRHRWTAPPRHRAYHQAGSRPAAVAPVARALFGRRLRRGSQCLSVPRLWAGEAAGGAAVAVGGADATAGAGAAGQAGAGPIADPRWVDPGPGVGCGTGQSAECSGTLSWGCSSPPSNPECVQLSGSYYCCNTVVCMRDWLDDDSFCPGAPILINCIPDAPLPERCKRYETSITQACCEP